MKRSVYFLVFLIVVLEVSAQRENYNDYSSLLLHHNLSTKVELSPPENIKNLEFLQAEILFFPKDDQLQSVKNVEIFSDPEGEFTQDDVTIITWNTLNENIIDFGYSSVIETKNYLFPIKEERFPITNLPEDIKPYVEATEFIDINEDIVRQANTIIEGESDLYGAVFKIAGWVNKNIEYNLSTLTADVVEKSTWVLENKKGVCDELTNLFISLLRSVGIPARFVSGMVYSNIDYAWSPHGWAEVYFPDSGWIPYDVTFGQYGWIDPSHVKLMQTQDSGESSITYQWRSKNTYVHTKPINLKTELLEEGEKTNPPLILTIKPTTKEAAPQSYIPIKVTVRNPYNFYVSDSLFLTKAPDVVDDNSKNIYLRPYEEKDIFWIIKIPDADPNFLYTTTIEVQDQYGEKVSEKIQYAETYETYIGYGEALQIVEESTKKQDTSYSKEISIECVRGREYYYVYETIPVLCTIHNIGNTIIYNLDTCYQKQCQKNDITIGSKITLSLEIPASGVEKNYIQITATNNEISVRKEIPLTLLTNPNLIINSLDIPEELPYNVYVNTSLVLSTSAPVYNVVIFMDDKKIGTIPDIEKVFRITINENSKIFHKGEIPLRIEYEDINGKIYAIEKKISVRITGVPFYVKILDFFFSLF